MESFYIVFELSHMSVSHPHDPQNKTIAVSDTAMPTPADAGLNMDDKG
jgi:hypothetical protein